MAAGFELPVPYERSFDSLYGMEVLEMDADRARARFGVTARLHGPSGALHGGVLFAAAESLTSMATAFAVMPARVAAGLANGTVVHEPVRAGTVELDARRVHEGADEWTWAVEARDAAGAVCATSTVVIAIREAR
jgi:1,4-dihydroxy-2-naphthoyl-CoA hydrolase